MCICIYVCVCTITLTFILVEVREVRGGREMKGEEVRRTGDRGREPNRKNAIMNAVMQVHATAIVVSFAS